MKCLKCRHEGPKCWNRRDEEEEMRSYCFLHKIYEPSRKECEDFKSEDDE